MDQQLRRGNIARCICQHLRLEAARVFLLMWKCLQREDARRGLENRKGYARFAPDCSHALIVRFYCREDWQTDTFHARVHVPEEGGVQSAASQQDSAAHQLLQDQMAVEQKVHNAFALCGEISEQQCMQRAVGGRWKSATDQLVCHVSCHATPSMCCCIQINADEGASSAANYVARMKQELQEVCYCMLCVETDAWR